MSRLDELLREAAAPAEPTFTVDDVARRVAARQRRRRAISTVAVLLVVFGLGGLAVTAQRPDDDDVVAGPALVEELTRSRWVLFAYSTVTTGPSGSVPWLEFGDDGRLGGSTGCRPFSADWDLDGDRLVVDDLLYQEIITDSFTPLPPEAGCPQDTERTFAGLLGSRMTVGRFEGDPDTLQLGSDTARSFVAFRALGSLPVPDAGALAGEWTVLGAGDSTVDVEGGVVTVDACPEQRWRYADGRLTPLDDPRRPCPTLGIHLPNARAEGSEPVEVRGDAWTLYLSDSAGVALLRRR